MLYPTVHAVYVPNWTLSGVGFARLIRGQSNRHSSGTPSPIAFIERAYLDGHEAAGVVPVRRKLVELDI